VTGPDCDYDRSVVVRIRRTGRCATRLFALTVGVVALGLLATAPAVADTTVTVNTATDETAPGDGICSLREAIAYADGANGADHDCGLSAAGTTTIKVPASSDHYFLASELEITGAVGPVVIDGAGVGTLGTTLDGAQHDRVLQVDAGANVSLSALTVTGGQAPAGAAGACAGGDGCPGADGGGIRNAGTLTLTGVTVSANAAGSGGDASSACQAAGGDAGGGGGIDNLGTLTLTNTTVTANTSGNGGNVQPLALSCRGPGGNAGAGGGIVNGSGATLSVTSSTISDNATGHGANPTRGCVPSGAYTTPGGDGGGIDNAGTLSVTATTVTGNSTGCGETGGNGGGIASSGLATITASTISHNGTGGGASFAGHPGNGGAGGGIDNSGTLNVLNSTIAFNTTGAGGNESPDDGGAGGGIAESAGGASATNLTIASNVTGLGGDASGIPGPGSGIYVAAGSFTEANTIVGLNFCAGKITDGGFDLQAGVPVRTGAGTLMFTSAGCPGQIGNPDLGPLQNNGGTTQTMALGSGSAAVDRLPSNPLNCPPTDQRGFIRPDGETTCDIGAYESGASPQLHITCCFFAGLTLAPHFFGLEVRGAEKRGSTVLAVLHKPRVLVLLVRRLAPRHRLLLVGLVRLGHHHAGRSLIPWNLRVGGRLLGPGRYRIVMYALDGNVLSLPAKPGARTLVVLTQGRVST
jgi:CSLREA domain-containing protein